MKSPSRLEEKLVGNVARASADFRLLEPNDRVLVAVSGGKDSHSMLYLLREVQRRAPFRFSLVAVNVDQGHPGFPETLLPGYLAAEGYEHLVVKEDTYSVVKEKIPEGKTYCSLCSRLRRGILYTTAKRIGATKIALGHHRDDLVETLLLNLFYSGQNKSMPPRLRSDDGENVVIRPLVYCAEADLAEFSAEKAFPIIPCDLCGSQDNLKRKRVKELVNELAAENPNVRGNLFAALGNVRPTHLLDRELSRALGLFEAAEVTERPGNEAQIRLDGSNRPEMTNDALSRNDSKPTHETSVPVARASRRLPIVS
ncbi:MAG TPA: tRNA 2-thiocytidine(32) synthetase TtcA [Polyangiaceae bacterium]|nr:tRNA 2-thiocytidine(32) synthetase TtcA [Polyangiaceae bacterium]